MNRLYRIFCGMLAAALLLLSGCAGKGAAKSGEAAGSSSLEHSAPAFTFAGTDLEGNAVSSDILSSSKLTMINVWATYCGPCLREMPDLGALAGDYETQEFQIIGIISDVMEGEDTSTAASLVEQTGAGYTHLLLNESIYYALLSGVSAVPTTFFLDENGTVLDTVVGAMEKSAWEEKINGLLEGL